MPIYALLIALGLYSLCISAMCLHFCMKARLYRTLAKRSVRHPLQSSKDVPVVDVPVIFLLRDGEPTPSWFEMWSHLPPGLRHICENRWPVKAEPCEHGTRISWEHPTTLSLAAVQKIRPNS